MTVAAEHNPWAVLVTEQGHLFVQQSAIRRGGCGCMDIGRAAGEYETGTDT
jgi:hypothetical protein